MTDEERQRLIDSLYSASDDRWSDYAGLCKEAANELERLAEEVKRLTITPLGIEAAAHAIRLVNGGSLDECHILARAALCGAFP